jgi:hypothetical protein
MGSGIGSGFGSGLAIGSGADIGGKVALGRELGTVSGRGDCVIARGLISGAGSIGGF